MNYQYSSSGGVGGEVNIRCRNELKLLNVLAGLGYVDQSRIDWGRGQNNLGKVSTKMVGLRALQPWRVNILDTLVYNTILYGGSGGGRFIVSLHSVADLTTCAWTQ